MLLPILGSKDDLKELSSLSTKTIKLIEDLNVYLVEPELQNILSKLCYWSCIFGSIKYHCYHYGM